MKILFISVFLLSMRTLFLVFIALCLFKKLLFRLFYAITPKYLLRGLYSQDIVHRLVYMMYSVCPWWLTSHFNILEEKDSQESMSSAPGSSQHRTIQNFICMSESVVHMLQMHLNCVSKACMKMLRSTGPKVKLCGFTLQSLFGRQSKLV